MKIFRWKVSIYILSMNFDVKRIMFNLKLQYMSDKLMTSSSVFIHRLRVYILNEICRHSLSNKEHVFQLSSTTLVLKMK